VLLSANLLAQSILAAKNAATPRPGQPKQAKHILTAVLRGLLNLELAYQEWWKKRPAEDYNHKAMQRQTTAVLYYKLTELVFEAPQVLLSWTVLLLRVTAESLSKLSPTPVSPSETVTPVWLWVFQAVSAGFGLVSLSIAAMDFMRLHPRSAWASSKPPSRLLFGLIDVDTSLWHSAAVGLFAFFNLLNRSLLYMMCTQSLGLFYMLTGIADIYHIVVLTAFVIVPGSLLLLNVLLMLGIRSWFVLPAAVISMFINIPWATGSTAQFRASRWSSWPAWFLQFVYCGGTMAFVMMAFSWKMDSLGAASYACSGRPGMSPSSLSGGWLVWFAIAVCSADLALFLGIAGWHSDRRRRYYKQHGNTENMAADLDIAVDLAVISYKFSGVYYVLQNPMESKDLELPQFLV
jgi:hypothetical protein